MPDTLAQSILRSLSYCAEPCSLGHLVLRQPLEKGVELGLASELLFERLHVRYCYPLFRCDKNIGSLTSERDYRAAVVRVPGQR